jgi:ATP-binding cassette subfamily A (ABC1) protein 3
LLLGAVLKDIHPGFIHYHIKPSEGITWGKLFGKMETAKEKFNLDAYSVGQTSLEQVFLNFARSQVEVDEYVKKPGLLDLLMNGIP